MIGQTGDKLRIIQLGSYPSQNRGARSNLLTIHERLQARGHASLVIDLTRQRHVKTQGVYFPRSIAELAKLLLNNPADIVHMHVGSLTLGKLALGGILNCLSGAKTLCTPHLGGHFYPKKGLKARRWGLTSLVLRQFDSLVAVSPEVAKFYQQIGAAAERVQLITPFPRLRVGGEAITLPAEIEDFCRQHTPLILSVGDYEPWSNVPMQFDILSRVRERYPSAGLLAVGDGRLHFRHMYQRAQHEDCNHILLSVSLSPLAISELVARAGVLLRTELGEGEPFSLREARYTGTPVIMADETESGALQVLGGLQVKRIVEDDIPPALSDGVDDVIRLYRQIAAKDTPDIGAEVCEVPSIGWGL